MSRVELGCGLIAIGRPWGTTAEVPSEEAALSFLQSAYNAGIRFFDTAPSYGLSEKRLGSFLQSLTTEQRASVTVATKFGEHWDELTCNPYTDHTFEALQRSLDTSQDLLGQIAVLQLHKTNVSLLSDPDVSKALDYALRAGVTRLGISVSDLESANMAVIDPRFKVIQLPYNNASLQFREIIQRASSASKQLLINRPFQMGKIPAENTSDNKKRLAVNAFRFILQEEFDGVVLTGTSNSEHLAENINFFNEALDA